MSLLDEFRASSSGRQALIVAALAVVIAGALTAVYFGMVRKPYDILYADVRPAEAATIVDALDKKKVPYRLEDGGATIRVPHEMIDSVRLGFAGEDLPAKGTVGFELFNKSDMGLTEFAQRINYQRALQGELARTIMSMDGIQSARVHLMLAEPSLFRDDRQPSKAAVTVIARAGKAISTATTQGIRQLVAAAVPDLTPADVVVLDGAGRTLLAVNSAAGDAAWAPVPTSPAVPTRLTGPNLRSTWSSPGPASPIWVWAVVGVLVLSVLLTWLYIQFAPPRRLSERRRRLLALRLEQALQG